jgi:cyclopropane fatty-acyl-phospholipid synthase-like methyltransferase
MPDARANRPINNISTLDHAPLQRVEERKRVPYEVEKYRAFWANKSNSFSRGTSVEFRTLVGKEIQLLFGKRRPISVLELGCGNGNLFDFFGFSPSCYRGVDFSPGMLAAFRSHHPELDLIEAEASSYVDERSYDLIFSHDVIEQFSPEMLDQHFANARKMMHPGSLLVCSAVPWRDLRSSYDWGLWFNGGTPDGLQWLKNQFRRMLGRDIMGHWYRTTEIVPLARRHQFAIHFHGSIAYPYRFHAVLSPQLSSQHSGA